MTTPKTVVPPTPEVAQPCDVAGCPPSLVCAKDGVCVTPPPQCTANGDCAKDQHCGLTGECLKAGDCRVSADCGMTESCRGTVCMLGSDCGQTKLEINPIPPNILILLDISTSMLEGLDGTLCIAIPGFTTCPPSKIAVASDAITQVTIKYHDTIYWGLAMFPGDGKCGAPTNVLAPAPGNADTVSSQVAATTPAGTTPINASIASIQGSTYLKDPSRKNYLLLMTDGTESCNGANADTTQRIMDMAAQGINTFVVGFGGAVDAMSLNSFAVAGGLPNTAGGTSYYQADSASQLDAALGSILARVVGCDFAYTTPPTDPAKVWAFFDGVMVDRDPKDGWVLDTAAKKVTFVGAACKKLQGGTIKDVQVVFGCPQPVQG